MELIRTALLFTCIFVLGCVLMGYEMLGSRYLNPYFGGGIDTWSVLISTVLYAMALGNFFSLYLIARFGFAFIVLICCGGAALYLFLIPLWIDPVFQSLSSADDGLLVRMVGSAAVMGVPVFLLSTLSPAFVDHLRKASKFDQAATGLVYGISTLGNVLGTLVTAFFLIPAIGSRRMTFLFAAFVFASGVLLSILSRKEDRL